MAIALTDIYSTTSNTSQTNDLTSLPSNQGRYLRVYGMSRATTWGYSIWELEAYGALASGTCTPTTCFAQAKNCGPVPDGCGGMLSCGTCVSGQTCSNNVCIGSTNPIPNGVPGNWALKWRDEFEGSSWTIMRPLEWTNSGVTHKAYNCSLSNGEAHLVMSDPYTGASINTQSTSYQLQVGEVVEARINFPGDGNKLYNWAAWWTSGPNWPSAGEHDVLEILGGSPTVNYHGSFNSQNMGNPFPNQYWGNAFHTYAVYRKAGSAEVWWDGKLARSYSTGDDGAGQDCIVSFGHDAGGNVVLGSAGMLRVDYVRMWRPAP